MNYDEASDTLAEAGRVLRKYSGSDAESVAFVVASASFHGLASRHTPGDTETDTERFKRIMREAADVLSPVCPHCGKELREPIAAAETGSELVRGE